MNYPGRRIVRLARLLPALVVIAWTLALATLGSCSSITWECPVRAKVRMADTSTTVRCPTSGKTVTITHPAEAP